MLNQFEWHDLPLELITINSSGVRLMVTPFNEEVREYDRFELHLFDFETLTLSLGGEITFSTLSDLEIANFSYTEDEELLSGEIGLLPGNQGYWKVAFSKAKWRLVQCV